jgi:hypothetical protein
MQVSLLACGCCHARGMLLKHTLRCLLGAHKLGILHARRSAAQAITVLLVGCLE